MIKRLVLVVMLSSLLSETGLAQSLQVEQGRLVKLKGSVGLKQNRVAQQIHDMTEHDSRPVYLYINSRGGRVDVAMNIVNSILMAQGKGHKVICIGHEKMYSAGLIIFSWCSERYVLPFTQIMWHSVHMSIMSRVNEKILGIMLGKTVRDNKYLWKALDGLLDMPEAEYKTSFYDGKFWYAEDLVSDNPRLLTILNSVRGIKNLFHTKRGKTNVRNKTRRRKGSNGPTRPKVPVGPRPGNDSRSK